MLTSLKAPPKPKKRKTEQAAPEEVGDDEVDQPEDNQDGEEQAEDDEDDGPGDEEADETAKTSGPGKSVKASKKKTPKESNLDEVEEEIEAAENQ